VLVNFYHTYGKTLPKKLQFFGKKSKGDLDHKHGAKAPFMGKIGHYFLQREYFYKKCVPLQPKKEN
jgi:hypothetical protein